MLVLVHMEMDVFVHCAKVSCCFSMSYAWTLHFGSSSQNSIKLLENAAFCCAPFWTQEHILSEHSLKTCLISVKWTSIRLIIQGNDQLIIQTIHKLFDYENLEFCKSERKTCTSLLVASGLVLWAVTELCFQQRYHCKHPWGEFKATRSGFTKPDSSTKHHDSRGYDVWFIFPCCFYIHYSSNLDIFWPGHVLALRRNDENSR